MFYRNLFTLWLFLFIFPSIFRLIGEKKETSIVTLSEKNLLQIIEKQKRFFNIVENSSLLSKDEMTRQAQGIATEYESYISNNPEDIYGLILLGKFLVRVGQEKLAIDYFMQADNMNPHLAVVKQQIANYLVQKGKPVDAFPFYILTVKLEPKEATYHFDLGNFLFNFQNEIISAGILNRSSVQSFTHRSFREASNLKPNNFKIQLRYAQSFFDFPNSDKNTALKTWEKIEKDFPNKSTFEKDYFRLCRARILLDLNRKIAAKKLINMISSIALESEKKVLLLEINGGNIKFR